LLNLLQTTMVTLLNPLRVGLQQRMPEPQIIVIFGASGDLTQRKLVPTLQIETGTTHSPETTIVGVARREWSDDDYFREQMREGIEQFSDGIGSEEMWQDFAVSSIAGDIDNPESYQTERPIERVRRETGNGKQDVLPLCSPEILSRSNSAVRDSGNAG